MATVDEIIESNQDFADTQKNDMVSFINAVADAASVNFSGNVESTNAGYNSVDSQVDAINEIAGSFPSVPSVVYPSYVAPEIGDISISELTHDITTLEAARSLILDDVQNGGYGIDTDDESALLDRTRDRVENEADKSKDEVERSYSSKRFNIPPGALHDASSKIQQSKRSALSEVNRDIYINRSEQFVRARQFAVQTAGVLDKTRADILEIQFRIEEARARFSLASFQSQLEAYRIKIMAALDQAKLTINIYETQSKVVSERVRAASDAAKVRVASYEANYKSLLGVLEYNLKQSMAELEAEKEEATLRLKAATSGTDFYSSIVSGAMSAINTVVSQSSETEE